LESLLRDIIRLLIGIGPEVLFLVTLSETAFFLGLLIPAEATVLVAAFLADRGVLELEHVLIATLLGAFLGDQLGYAFGRFGGARVASRGGRVGRLWRRHEARASRLFRQRSIVAVTLARFVSFVRTLMPWLAGMSHVPYLRFMVYDALGVLGWGIASIAAGYLAGESWRQVAELAGTTTAIILSGIAVVLFILYIRHRRQPRPPAGEATTPVRAPFERPSDVA
jgi:membrane-associated protein